jgi:hypothetical protein
VSAFDAPGIGVDLLEFKVLFFTFMDIVPLLEMVVLVVAEPDAPVVELLA